MSAAPVRATLRIPDQHPMFAGHFPGQPIVPGAWLLAQALAALEAAVPGPPGWGEIATAKFHRVVRPGAQLELTLSGEAAQGLRLEVREAAELVLSARFAATPATPAG
jgi:3-hydroxymyristoyl/3-hydroxydecanoyl-(acyl carrier protein) dehydratase